MYNKENNFHEGTPKESMVVTFAGPTGTGKTTLLVNVAGIIQKYNERKPSICMVDMNLFYPSIVHMLHQEDMEYNQVNFSDILNRIEDISLDELKMSTMIHTPTNIHLIGMALGEMDVDAKLFNEEKIRKLIQKLRQLYDIVLIDTTADIKQDENLVSYIESDKIFLVTNPDINKVLHARKIIQTMKFADRMLQNEELLFNKTEVIINKFHKKKGFDAEMIKNTLFDRPIARTIEENMEITLMHNNGMFFYDKTSKEAKGMIELARIVNSVNS